MLPPLVKLKVDDPDLQRVQDRIHDTVKGIARVPLLDGNLVTQTFGTGQTIAVSHGLGRNPVGYLVVSNSSMGALLVEADKTLRTNGTISLTSVGTFGTFDIWVF